MVGPSIWTPPVSPDFSRCNDFYHSQNKPDAGDCLLALQTLYEGDDDRIWHIGGGSYGIPQVRTFGTCQIELQASGPAATEGQRFSFAPNNIRNMAGWVIDQCVEYSRVGGYATAGISAIADYVANPTTFYEDPFPLDTTFLNVVVWNSDRSSADFNPGNMDPHTGALIVWALGIEYAREPDESPLKPNIERNFSYFRRAVLAMVRGNGRTWWQSVPENLMNGSTTNLTEPMNNLTLPANITLPAKFTPLGLNSTSICAGAGQGTAPECQGQDDNLVTTS